MLIPFLSYFFHEVAKRNIPWFVNLVIAAEVTGLGLAEGAPNTEEIIHKKYNTK